MKGRRKKQGRQGGSNTSLPSLMKRTSQIIFVFCEHQSHSRYKGRQGRSKDAKVKHGRQTEYLHALFDDFELHTSRRGNDMRTLLKIVSHRFDEYRYAGLDPASSLNG
jgi:hypothetical protein